MLLLIQIAPLLLLVVLLGVARRGPVLSCLAAIAASMAAFLATHTAIELPGYALASLTQGAWLSVVPVGIVAAGLVFHAAVVGREQPDAAPGDVIDRVFTAAFLLGPFAETVTGFCVGAIFALGVMRRAGVPSVPAAAMSLLTIGTETSGSIISPSQANGLVGLRPTVGLVPGVGIAPISASQDTAGPMDRTVAAAALTLTAIAGKDPESSYAGLWGLTPDESDEIHRTSFL